MDEKQSMLISHFICNSASEPLFFYFRKRKRTKKDEMSELAGERWSSCY